MQQKMKQRQWIEKLTGLLFSAYSAYNVFVVVRDGKRGLSPEGILISIVVALIFAVFAGFLWTWQAGVKAKDMRFLMIRRTTFIIALLAVFALKLRMAGKVIAYLDFSKIHTVVYGAAYLMTQAALLLLIVYYVFILKMLPLYPKASVILPAIAMVLFLCSLILEAILFFAYGIGLEASPLRTIVSRPVFYLGFIGLCVYFLIPPEPLGVRPPSDDKSIVAPAGEQQANGEGIPSPKNEIKITPEPSPDKGLVQEDEAE